MVPKLNKYTFICLEEIKNKWNPKRKWNPKGNSSGRGHQLIKATRFSRLLCHSAIEQLRALLRVHSCLNVSINAVKIKLFGSFLQIPPTTVPSGAHQSSSHVDAELAEMEHNPYRGPKQFSYVGSCFLFLRSQHLSSKAFIFSPRTKKAGSNGSGLWI